MKVRISSLYFQNYDHIYSKVLQIQSFSLKLVPCYYRYLPSFRSLESLGLLRLNMNSLRSAISLVPLGIMVLHD